MEDPESSPRPSAISVFQQKFGQRLQILLDKSTPYRAARWTGLVLTVLIYTVRVWYLAGFYLVTYGLGIYNLNLVLGFLTPQLDVDSDEPSLPTTSDQEFKPFVRRLPEFKFWYASMKSVVVGFILTFFKVFDIPVFWPVLLLYWCFLFVITMRRQIMHMIKYKYVPFTMGKKRYDQPNAATQPAQAPPTTAA